MTDDERVTLQRHGERIAKLEKSQDDMHLKMNEVNNNVLETKNRSAAQAEIMIKQNSDLIKQNTTFSEKLSNIYDTTISTKANEDIRNHELNKIKIDSRLKLVTLIIGSGSAGFIVIQAVMQMFTNT